MCGLAGYLSPNRVLTAERLGALGERMATALSHRGPDDSGVWLDPNLGAVLAHRRLSILDLSPAGHQPMASASGRYVVVMNGEIYNHKDLAETLAAEGTWFRGHSDTEVAVAAFERWGIESALERFVGMFAFGIVEPRERRLWLVRDRLGEKPLYYGRVGDGFAFASELKALRLCPGWTGGISKTALGLLFRYGYIPAPYTIFNDINKLEPGQFARVPLEAPERLAIGSFWSAGDMVLDTREKDRWSEREAIDGLDELLHKTIVDKMLADVPLGAFLSGGVDSSIVVALMQANSMRPVKTFSIGFFEPEFDEAPEARSVAQHLGTEHTELYVSPEQAREVIPELPAIYDEPFGDSSQIPTFLISQLAKSQVGVALSGDGGDELFGGYPRHFTAEKLWRAASRVPRPLLKLGTQAVLSISSARWDWLFRCLRPLIPRNYRYDSPGDRLHKAAGLQLTSADSIYEDLISFWREPELIVPGAGVPDLNRKTQEIADQQADFVERMLYRDLTTYLPDDILTKVDRASMALGLEVRVPLLDHRIVEFAWRQPVGFKVRDDRGKWLLRQVLYRYVPSALVDRPKTGFNVPVGEWLRGPLRDWGEALLDAKRIEQDGFLDPEPVRARWRDHLNGARNWQYHLWPVLMFQSWLEQHKR